MTTSPAAVTPDQNRRLLVAGIIAFIAGVLLLLAVLVPVRAEATPPNPEHKVTLCHATDSYTNPYIVETVDVASVKFQGHDGHNGVVFYAAIPKHEKWGDIIPPFDFGPGNQYAGKNWTTEGQAFWNAACQLPVTTTTSTTPGSTTTTSTIPSTTTTAPGTTTTTVPGTTTTTAPGTTTTTAPGTTTTTAPGTTTTTAPGTTTTTVPETTTTTVPETTTTTVPGSTTTVPGSTTTVPGSTTTVPGSTTTAPTTTTTAPSTTTTTTADGVRVLGVSESRALLPATGTAATLLAAAGVALMLAGGALVIVARRRSAAT